MRAVSCCLSVRIALPLQLVHDSRLPSARPPPAAICPASSGRSLRKFLLSACLHAVCLSGLR